MNEQQIPEHYDWGEPLYWLAEAIEFHHRHWLGQFKGLQGCDCHSCRCNHAHTVAQRYIEELGLPFSGDAARPVPADA